MFSLHRAAIALVLLCWAPILAAQSAYPTKPIHMVIPLAAGSAVDNARISPAHVETGPGIVIDISGAPAYRRRVRKRRPLIHHRRFTQHHDELPHLIEASWDSLKDRPGRWLRPSNGIVTSNDRRTAAPPL